MIKKYFIKKIKYKISLHTIVEIMTNMKRQDLKNLQIKRNNMINNKLK